MPYPEPLLPKADYKQEVKAKDLVLAASDYYLIRISTGPIQDPDNIKIRELCHPTKEFIGLSTNLFGIFQLPHLPFKALDRPRIDYWVRSDGSIDPATINYEEVTERQPIFIKLNHVHDTDIAAIKQVDQKSITIGLKVLVLHKPTKPNYWHFEVRVFNPINRQEFDRDHLPDWAKNAIKKFVEIDICHKASGRTPSPFTIIPNGFYIEETF